METLGAALLLSEATDSLMTVSGRLDAGRFGAAIAAEVPFELAAFDELLVAELRT